MQRYRTKIGGKPRSTPRSAVVTNPYNGSPVGEVGLGGDAEIEAAIASSLEAFATTRRTPTHERVRVLEAVSRALDSRAPELADLICRESGKPITSARAEVARAVTTFALAAAEARNLGGELLPIDQQPGQEGRLCVYRRVPRGPVSAIAPFNFPLNLVAHKVAPALAVGASIVLKPPQQAPLTAHVLSDIVDAAGAPPGAFNVVHCPPEVGERLVTDERMKVLSFTGSDALGWRLKALAGKKQVILELGGNAPCVVDEGVPLDELMPRLVDAAWTNAGQVCIKAQRLFVHRAVHEAFVERFVRATEAVHVGDPLDPRTLVGPLIEPKHVERVLAWVAEAESQGARRLCGGRVEGQLVWPIVLDGTTSAMRVRSREVFGPVTVIEAADDFDHALALANEGEYGLQAGVFTPRVDHALRAYEVLDYGGVLVNEVPSFRVDNYPYGGVRDSGFGREGVRFAMQEMTEPKTLILRA